MNLTHEATQTMKRGLRQRALSHLIDYRRLSRMASATSHGMRNWYERQSAYSFGLYLGYKGATSHIP